MGKPSNTHGLTKREAVKNVQALNTTSKFKLTPAFSDKIIDLYMQGNSVIKIGAMPDMPSAKIIYHWMQHHAWFREKMKQARAMRGMYFEEKALEAADLSDETNVQSHRLKVDTFKWAAEVNDRNTYGKSTKISGDVDAPLKLVIETGVPAPNEHQKPPELAVDGTVQKYLPGGTNG